MASKKRVDNSEVRERCEAVGRRSASALRRVLINWPAYEGRLRALAEYLKVDRNVCQRAHAASRAELSGLETLAKLPGLASLREFVARAEAKECDPRAVQSLRQSIEQVESLIADAGGRQSDLRAFVTAQIDFVRLGEPAVQLERRRTCFQSLGDLLGVRLDMQYNLGVLNPVSADEVEAASLRAYVRVTRRAGGLPITSTSFRMATSDIAAGPSDASATSFGRPDRLDFGATVLKEYCDPPGMPVSSHPVANGSITIVIDTPTDEGAKPATAVIASRIGPHPHPLKNVGDGHHNIGRVGIPTARYVIDAYLPRELAACCRPVPRAFLTNPSGMIEPSDHWFEQVQLSSRIELIPEEQAGVVVDGYPAASELTERFFELIGRRRSEFAGFRLDIPYPLHNALYMITFQRVAPGEGAVGAV